MVINLNRGGGGTAQMGLGIGCIVLTPSAGHWMHRAYSPASDLLSLLSAFTDLE